jgi:HEAT repeat protein
MASVEAVRGLPAEVALPVLYRAARDLDPAVRRQAAEVAADLPRGTHGPQGASILRTLLLDRDPSVWTQARALLARVSAAPGEPLEPTLPATIESPPTGARPLPSLDPDTSASALAAGEGGLVVEAPSGVFFQIDRRGWQTGQSGATAPLPLPSGPHTVVSLAESQELLIAEGVTTTVKVRESAVEQFVQSGLQALRKGDLRTAQRQLERARAMCERNRQHEVPCHTLAFVTSYHLGTLLESEKEYGRAMTDFRRAAALAGRVKARADLKSEVEGALRRLGSRVGEVQVGTVLGNRCRRTTFWLDPGTHRLDVGNGRFEMVTVRAGQTLDAGGCR